MAQFKYKARTLDGKVIKGIMNVADDTELQQKLHEQDAFLLNAKEMKNTKGVKQFKPKVLADFSRQLGTLIASGVTLVRALNIIASGEAVSQKQRGIYEDLLRQIRQGIALGCYGGTEWRVSAFDDLYVPLSRDQR